MNTIKFRVAAKTDVGLVRQNNEDNFQVSADLSVAPMRWVNNEICSLGDKGLLLVVADGMGGMNAGEVASEIAIEVVREAFAPENLTDEILKDRYTIERFMNSVIVDADKQIKQEAKNNPETRGMGTTIVIAWVLYGVLYLSWCGDSRAYVYNPQAGLHQISKDHSFVQSLVDKGAISKEDAFDYPESNIITRCLSDSSQKAKPESLLQPYNVCDNDIILLCTDGLSGMIRDNEIEDIIRSNEHDMDVCSDELIRGACEAEGSDNITLCICQILSGANACDPTVFDTYDKRLVGLSQKGKESLSHTAISGIPGIKETKGKRKFLWIGLVLLFAVLLIGGGFLINRGLLKSDKDESVVANDSVKKDKSQTTIHNIYNTSDGNRFTVECEDGTIKEGLKAWPDGKYELADGTVVTVKDSSITSIVAGHQTKIEEKTGVLNKIENGRHENEKETEEHKTDTSTKKRNLPPFNSCVVVDNAEDKLTPVKENNSNSTKK
ncbi:PP2C family protein-serine/threonine phosphatase [Leyella stercorea]|uniref:PP2C family protein-serine/threonine phosphatase n=1 Tax=Leyella stercorea TaxID=363265 RepID=UPI00242C4738|nr:protein phosphatase 2C domain-containing protein [Leyella stercorea]